MSLRPWIAVAVSMLVMGAGCERQEAKPSVSPAPVALAAPTTAPAAVPAPSAPATQPAATEPVGILMTIDQRFVDFPQARPSS